MRIEWDDVNPEIGGGFTVVEGKLKNPPEGWVEDKPGHWQPQWAPCRYRRLSKVFIDGRPIVIPFCLLPQFRKNVSYETCAACTLHKPPADFVAEYDDSELPDNIIPYPTINYANDTAFIPDESIPIVTPTPWEPCKHRKETEKVNCSGCKTSVCQCVECPLYNKTVLKKNCRACDFREP